MPGKFWLVTIERQFANTKGKRHARTFVTDVHPLEIIEREGHPNPKYDYESVILFMAEISKQTFEAHRDILKRPGE